MTTAQSERAVELHARLAAIVDSANDAVYGQTLEGMVTSWNAAAAQIFGYSAEEMIGGNISRLIPPEYLHEEARIIGWVQLGKKVDHYETIRQCKNGGRINVSVTVSPVHDAEGAVIGASKIVRDITERVQAEEQMAKLLQEIGDLKAALDEHAIVAVTDPEGRITYANGKFCAISKYSREELVGQDHRIINSGYHSKEFMRDLWTTIARGRVWKGELRNRAKDGSFYWVETTIVPFMNADGKPQQYVSIRTDITRVKRAEAEVRQLNRELERRVRERTTQLEAANEELEAFSYSVSHDLRAPIRHIDGFLGLLQKSAGAALGEKDRHYLAQIGDASKQMSRLIEDLLAFSRMGRAELRHAWVDLNRLLEQVVKELQPEIGTRKIVWLRGRLGQVRADPAMLRLVLFNLLSNAIKYTRPRDPAEIEIGRSDDSAEEIVVFVRDNGVGFDMQYADKLFGVFQRLHFDDEFEGTGVGLASVRRIIARHGGRTWAKAAPDQGATFFFSLPKADPVEQP